jgi:muramoyltetrapeptide carboxypeptidase
MLLQLLQAGVLGTQQVVLLGDFGRVRPSPNDRGYRLSSAVEHVRQRSGVPILTGLPFGHVATKLTVPVGRKVTLAVQGRDVLLGW